MAEPEDNPILQVHKALWSLLESAPGFTAMVKAGNRIKFVGTDRSPIKETVQAADLPEVRIIPTSANLGLGQTSNSSRMAQIWELQVSTGDQRVMLTFETQWQIFIAMSRWQEVLSALTWNGKKFVKSMQPTAVNIGVTDKDLSRNIVGWSTLWSCEIEMWFTTADLKLLAEPSNP